VTSCDDGRPPNDYVEDPRLLPPEESLGEDEVDLGPDKGYSPPQRPWGLTVWGSRIARRAWTRTWRIGSPREEPELSYAPYGDEIGDTSDTDGELIDN
jgi:hypothetical protein